MQRTQLYLKERTLEALKLQAKVSKVSLSELVRIAVDRYLEDVSLSKRLAVFKKSQGIWADRPFTEFESIHREFERHL